MEQANDLSLGKPFLARMTRNKSPAIIKSREEIIATYNSLPNEDKEKIKKFLRVVRNDEDQRIITLENIKELTVEDKKQLYVQELLRQFGYFNFELSEEERFLQRYCTYRDASLILTNLGRVDYHNAMRAVKNGLRKGVGDFLERTEKPCLYFADMREFVYDDSKSVEKRVDEEITRLGIKLEGIPEFAEDIKAGFNTYIYIIIIQKDF